MPTVLREGPYRFFWYSADRAEPPHVHVERDETTVKFWLETFKIERNNGFSGREINRIQSILAEHRDRLLARWQRELGR